MWDGPGFYRGAKKLETRKMLENGSEFNPSAECCAGCVIRSYSVDDAVKLAGNDLACAGIDQEMRLI
jgi:hypothetical protein